MLPKRGFALGTWMTLPEQGSHQTNIHEKSRVREMESSRPFDDGQRMLKINFNVSRSLNVPKYSLNLEEV